MNSQKTAQEILHVKSKKVSCSGSSSSSGHPLVYLNMGDKNSVICPYCSKNFVLEQAKKNS